jgi:hypothetical protein
MLHHRQYTQPAIRSLLDHLDAVLTGCDALLKAQRAAANSHDLLRLELTVIAHVLQAREDMTGLRMADGAVGSQIALFLTVTSCLEEAAPAGDPAPFESAATCLIGGRIAVETLIALTAAMHDFVELCFVLLDEHRQETGMQAAAPVPEALIWATGPGCT